MSPRLSSSGTSISRRSRSRRCGTQYGLDQPFVVQYLLWLQHLLHGNFGLSLEYQRPNADLIGEQLGLTIALALFSFVLTWAIAVPAGIYSATHPRSLGRPRADRHQLCRRRHAQLHAGADPDVGRLRLFRHQRHRPLFARVRRRAVELGQAVVDLLAAYLAAGAGAGHRRHRAADAASCAPTCWTSSTSPTS